MLHIVMLVECAFIISYFIFHFTIILKYWNSSNKVYVWTFDYTVSVKIINSQSHVLPELSCDKVSLYSAHCIHLHL